ncbi:hypothetical protein EYR38_004954 [Pleurotus pulmonarius]|nr:hypothetical protein EYR38_004954 [Pleurotus pulmonarius]
MARPQHSDLGVGCIKGIKDGRGKAKGGGAWRREVASTNTTQRLDFNSSVTATDTATAEVQAEEIFRATTSLEIPAAIVTPLSSSQSIPPTTSNQVPAATSSLPPSTLPVTSSVMGPAPTVSTPQQMPPFPQVPVNTTPLDIAAPAPASLWTATISNILTETSTATGTATSIMTSMAATVVLHTTDVSGLVFTTTALTQASRDSPIPTQTSSKTRGDKRSAMGLGIPLGLLGVVAVAYVGILVLKKVKPHIVQRITSLIQVASTLVDHRDFSEAFK